jgi:hypothetical protein
VQDRRSNRDQDKVHDLRHRLEAQKSEVMHAKMLEEQNLEQNREIWFGMVSPQHTEDHVSSFFKHTGVKPERVLIEQRGGYCWALVVFPTVQVAQRTLQYFNENAPVWIDDYPVAVLPSRRNQAWKSVWEQMGFLNDVCWLYGESDRPLLFCNVCGDVNHVSAHCPKWQEKNPGKNCPLCGQSGHPPLICREAPRGWCYTCQEPGHTVHKCPRHLCNLCGQLGHTPKDCLDRDPVENLEGKDPLALYVKFLPENFTNDKLKELFDKSGNVTSAMCVIDKDTGNHRGFGFVRFKTGRDARNAMKLMEGYRVTPSRTLRIRYADIKPGASNPNSNPTPA